MATLQQDRGLVMACECIGPHTEACQDERVRQVEAFWIREKQDKQNWRERAEKAERERDELRARQSFRVYGSTEEMFDDMEADDECEHEWGNTILTTNPPQRRCTKCKHTEFIGGRR